MNSLKLWLTLQVHGRQAYEELIDRQLKLAAFFANWVRSSEIFELAAPQVLPIVNFRIKRAGITDEERRAAHEAIVHEVTRDGRRWISTTLVNGAIRDPDDGDQLSHRASPPGRSDDCRDRSRKETCGASVKNQAGKL